MKARKVCACCLAGRLNICLGHQQTAGRAKNKRWWMGWGRVDISIKASSRLIGKTWTYFEVKSLIKKKSESYLLLKVSEGLVFRAGLAFLVRCIDVSLIHSER